MRSEIEFGLVETNDAVYLELDEYWFTFVSLSELDRITTDDPYWECDEGQDFLEQWNEVEEAKQNASMRGGIVA